MPQQMVGASMHLAGHRPPAFSIRHRLALRTVLALLASAAEGPGLRLLRRSLEQALAPLGLGFGLLILTLAHGRYANTADLKWAA